MAAAPKFTPGPYRVSNGALVRVLRQGAPTDVVAGIHRRGKFSGKDNDEEVVATAHLFAAAPDLYDALELLIADVADYEAWKRPCHAVDVACAALAKARGEVR